MLDSWFREILADRHQFLAPIGANADKHQAAQSLVFQTDVEVDAICPEIHVVNVAEVSLLERRQLHSRVSRWMVDALSPAALPKNSAKAGSKSLLELPRRYNTGSPSVTLGERRAQGGRIALVKRRLSRRSWTRGAWISSSPAAVVTVRGAVTPLRTTSACPASSR